MAYCPSRLLKRLWPPLRPRARDTRLHREVALKVLLLAVAHDPERITRFARESRVLASLNHPHIALLYGLEKWGGVSALVIEYVDGPTLADRIALGAVPVDEVLQIARQIRGGARRGPRAEHHPTGT